MRKTRASCFAAGIVVLCLCAWLWCAANAWSAGVAPAPKMPAHWKMISDIQLPAEQVKSMSGKLGANLSSVRNTVYDVNGKRVQINTILAPDADNAAMLMAKLRSMKSEQALLRKDLTIYEFVGPNEVLDVIAEGRRQLASQ